LEQGYRFGRFEVRPAHRNLCVDGRPVPLGSRAFDLLVTLIERRDRVVPGDELVELIWPGLVVEENNLRQQVAALRRVLGAEAIATVAGRGYRFTPTLDADAVAVDEPSASARGGAPHNLPLNLPRLIGRESDLAAATQRLRETHLLTLVGAGGVGKTRLAIELAGSNPHACRHGTWLVELAPLSDPARVPQAVASALDVHEEPGRALQHTLLDALRQRELLIVLDNCEHLIEACARWCEEVLRTCASVRILATSREALGITGETTWRVPSLRAARPEASEAPDVLADYAATRLFVERAAAVSPGFALTPDNAAAVARICHQLDGMPLALELAAARVSAMRVQQVAERLSDRFALLTRGSRTALRRHQTLRALIEWSHELLSEPERVLLRRLSVFAGGWTLEAAGAVCGGEGLPADDVMETLSLLVEKSMVLADDEAAEPRYRMLETIRQYARERLLQAGEELLVGDRHLVHFVRFAEEAEPQFYHPDQLRWYARVDDELENLRAALNWSLARQQCCHGLRLGAGLHRYWVARLYWREATAWFVRFLALAEAEPRIALHARGHSVVSHIANHYDPAVAEHHARESLRMARSLDDPQRLVDALWVTGWVHNPRLDGSATPFYAESVALANTIDYVWGAVHACTWFGMYKVAMGEYEAAKPLLIEGIGWGNRLGGDASLIGRCKGNLGLAEMLQGNLTLAHSYLDESLALRQRAGNKNGIAEALWFLGWLALRERDHAHAARYFKQCLALHRSYPASVWVTRGMAYLMMTGEASAQTEPAARLAGALAARDAGTGRVRAHLGSRAAIAEYDAALAIIRDRARAPRLQAAWDEGARLDEEAAISLALD
jgi:non-specific serine/threonine protein kinase